MNTKNKKTSFSKDPFVTEAIQKFMLADIDLKELSASTWIHDVLGKYMSMVHELKKAAQTISTFPPSREGVEAIQAIQTFIQQQLSHKIENTSLAPSSIKDCFYKSFSQLKNEQECILYTNLLKYFFEISKGYDSIFSSNGKPQNWCLNVLICVLVEHCKKNYPSENNFSEIAKKFSSSKFKMNGWKPTSSRRIRYLIADRFKEYSNKFNTRKTYQEIYSIFHH